MFYENQIGNLGYHQFYLTDMFLSDKKRRRLIKERVAQMLYKSYTRQACKYKESDQTFNLNIADNTNAQIPLDR